MSTLAQRKVVTTLLAAAGGAIRRGASPKLIVVAIIVTLLGVFLLWEGPSSVAEQRCDTVDIREGASQRIRMGFFPPGTKCETTQPDGTRTVTTYVPWAEWLTWLAVVWLPTMLFVVIRGLRSDVEPRRS